MESIAMTLIAVAVAPFGVVESNSRSRAVMELKIDELTSSEPTNSSRKCPRSGATLTRFCDEPAWGGQSRPTSVCCWRRCSHAKHLHIRIATQRMKLVDVGRGSFRVRPLASSSRSSSKPTPP